MTLAHRHDRASVEVVGQAGGARRFPGSSGCGGQRQAPATGARSAAICARNYCSSLIHCRVPGRPWLHDYSPSLGHGVLAHAAMRRIATGAPTVHARIPVDSASRVADAHGRCTRGGSWRRSQGVTKPAGDIRA